MKKGIVEIEMPENCFECQFRYDAAEMPIGPYEYRKIHRCLLEPDDLEDAYLHDISQKRQEWCPIKEKPDRKCRMIHDLTTKAAIAYGTIELEDVLKPCRVCGSKPKVQKRFTSYRAKCKSCGCLVMAETKIDLYDLWNGGQENGE